MEINYNHSDAFPGLGDFIDTLRYNRVGRPINEQAILTLLPCMLAGHRIISARSLTMVGRDLDLTPILYRTTEVELLDLVVKKTGKLITATFTLKVPTV